eukprot:3626468-Prymnesium_polylepis.1
MAWASSGVVMQDPWPGLIVANADSGRRAHVVDATGGTEVVRGTRPPDGPGRRLHQATHNRRRFAKRDRLKRRCAVV